MATTKAFVLIETAVGKTHDVVGSLRGVGGVSSVDVVTGPYDIIVVLEAKDLSSVGDMVTGRVHTHRRYRPDGHLPGYGFRLLSPGAGD